MRWFVLFVSLLAGVPASAGGLATKTDCLSLLGEAIRMAEATRYKPAVFTDRLKDAPQGAEAASASIIAAAEDIARQHQAIADQIFEICQLYE